MQHIGVVGLGYVGLPLAVGLARHFRVTGIDISAERITQLKDGNDRTGEVESEALLASTLQLDTDIAAVADATVLIVTVPTPVDAANKPDLRPLLSATRSIAGILRKDAGTIIVYESTVYPGVTEDICGGELEKLTGLKHGTDFFLGYSPERINPGDREHSVDKITKVISADTPQTLDILAEIYGKLTSGNVFRAASIKVAEAAKVIENAQRDINIAFVNEITQIFSRIGISIQDVLDAAGTKWNFLKFQPGLVGGHCIGVDPYYLAYLAQQEGFHPKVILAGRQTNDDMSHYLADELHSRLGRTGRLLVLGVTFKEDVSDLRNSKVVDLVRRLEWIGHSVDVHDPLADAEEAHLEYGLRLSPDALDRQEPCYDAVILAVPHATYRALGAAKLASLLLSDGLVMDLKGVWRAACQINGNIRYWCL